MATLTVAVIARTGLLLAPVAAAVGGDLLPNTGKEFLLVKNDGMSASINVTITPTKTVDGLTPAARVVAVAAGAQKLFGPFSPSEYNNANGQVPIAYSAVTDITVQAISLTAVPI